MRLLVSILLIAVLSYLAGMYGPWWTIAIVAFLVALLIPQGIGRSFLAGFLAILLLWVVLALLKDMSNNNYLSERVAQLFKLGAASLLLVLITGIIGGLVAGFAAMSGASLKPAKRRY
jgi:hypothetical protein